MDGIFDRRPKKSTEDEGEVDGKDEPFFVDWGKEFAVLAVVYGWLPETVMKLTMPQFEIYQAYAYEHLAKQEVAGKMSGIDMLGSSGASSGKPVGYLKSDSQGSYLDKLEEAALRLKKRRFGDTAEKKTFTLGEVQEEMRKG